MSLKEDVNFLKDEISTQEKFIESFFKLEKVWAKYKMMIIGTIFIVIIAFIGMNINAYLQTQNTIKANNAFNILLNDTENTEAKVILKDLNPKLLMIITHLENTKNGKNETINLEFLDELTKYNMAIEKNDLEAIDKIILNSKFLLKEYALFQKALILTINKNYADAKETLDLIPANSTVLELSNKLKHHLLTK